MPTLYVNGDSHSQHCYPAHTKLPTATELLADRLGLEYQNQALAGGSNQRIIRTTLEYLPKLDPAETVIVIGWSSFERTEWYYREQWHQICGQAAYNIDPELKLLWKNHITKWNLNVDKERFCRMQEQHQAIWCFHVLLTNLGYQHLFYQGCDTFFFDMCPEQNGPYQLLWAPETWAHNPYVTITGQTRYGENFSQYVSANGCKHADEWAHYGQDAQQVWADYLEPLLQYKIDQLP
jgi:hypothetical protein